MSATASSARRAILAALAAAALAACETSEVEVVPFRMAATLADGSPLTPDPELDPVSLVARVSGIYRRDGSLGTRATIEDPVRGVVTLSFDSQAAPDVEFPLGLDGLNVTALVGVDAEATAPDGTPLPVTGIRLQTGGVDGASSHFLIGEGSRRAPNGVAAIPVPLVQLLDVDPGVVDFPSLLVWSDSIYFEPSECGMVYYDRVRVIGGEGVKDVARDETVTMRVGDPEAPRWNVRNVLSWHRVGGDCPDEPRVWTQVVLWR